MSNTLTLAVTIPFLFLFLLTSCSDNSVTTNSGSGNVTMTLSGRVQNWYLGSDKKMFAVARARDTSYMKAVLDSCSVDSIGNFSLRLPAPPDSLLRIFTSQVSNMCTTHVVINPAGLKICYLILEVRTQSDSAIGYALNSNDSALIIFTGRIIGNTSYFNNSGSITGTDTCNIPMTQITTWNVPVVKGWNTYYQVFDSSVIGYVRSTVTIQPQNVQWYYMRYFDWNDRQGESFQKNMVHFFKK